MDEVKHFEKFNVGVVTETFRFETINDFDVQNTGVKKVTTWSNDPTARVYGAGVGEVKVSFDERNRKAVADLFRKMADSLDPVEVRQYFGVLKAYDRETELNTVEVGDATICNLRRMSSLISYEVGDRVHVIRIGSQYYLNGRVD